jgi:hypothetical protein
MNWKMVAVTSKSFNEQLFHVIIPNNVPENVSPDVDGQKLTPTGEKEGF